MLLASPFKICMIYLLSLPSPKKTRPHFFIISPPKKPFSGGLTFPQTSKLRKLRSRPVGPRTVLSLTECTV